MCLLGVVLHAIPDSPLLVLANREELYARPSTAPDILRPPAPLPAWLGGVDLVAGGTWLGVNALGLVVAVTNRPGRSATGTPTSTNGKCSDKAAEHSANDANSPSPHNTELRSRGLLCRRLLQASDPMEAQRAALDELTQHAFAGCNLVMVSRAGGVVIEAGDHIATKPLVSGVNLITNGNLNALDDPRIRRVRAALESVAGKDRDAWLSYAATLCGAGAEQGQPAICLKGTDRGTVSSTLLALGNHALESRYLFADGPPAAAPYQDYSPLLRELLRCPGAIPTTESGPAHAGTSHLP